MLEELCLPDDVELTVVFDSAFDANVIHRVCREQHFRAIFPLDPNRTLSAGPAIDAAGLAGAKVVHGTRSWSRREFTLLTLQYTNEDHVFLRRRHGGVVGLASRIMRPNQGRACARPAHSPM